MIRTKGFTLVELLAAVVIIGLLLAAGAASLRSAQMTSRDSQRIGDVTAIGKALDAYSSAHGGRYPVLSVNVTCPALFGTPSQLTSYLPSNAFPVDPLPAVSSGNCTSYSVGYMYYANVTGSPAQTLSEKYILVAGLEKTLATDNVTLIDAHAFLSKWSSPTRYPYYFAGPYCGSSC